MGVFKRDGGYWIDFSFRGVRYREPAGHTFEVARRYLTRRRAEVEQDALVPGSKRITLAQWAPTYLKWARDQKASWKRDDTSLRQLLPKLGERPLDTITPKVVEQYQRSRQVETSRRGVPPSAATINREVACLKKMLTLAHRDRVIREHPARGAEMLREDNERSRVLTTDELARILTHAADWLRPIITVAYWTAMRRAEVVNLRWDRVDFTAGLIRLRADETKTREGRVVPMAPPVVCVLRAVPKAGERVFEAHADAVTKAFTRACEKAGAAEVVFHDLRHSAVTRWADEGWDQALIMRVSGHKTASVFRRYRSATEDQIRAMAHGGRHDFATTKAASGARSRNG